MSIELHHHPRSRAAGIVWMLEELGQPYSLTHVAIGAEAQRTPEFLAVNPMGKVPVLIDGEAIVTEAAAIGVYLADRYALGRLSPALDDPARATFLRWCFYAPSVIEPGCMAKASGWKFSPGAAGWGRWDDLLATVKGAVSPGPWLLGESFSMADVVFGGTVRWMLQFGMLPKDPELVAYSDRLGERPALQRADAINAAELARHTAS